MEFNEKLQQLRKQKGLTQEELAAALYVSRTAVSKWESGRGYPGIDSLRAIAAYFSVTVDSLLSGDEVLTIAQDEQKQAKSQTCDLVFGLLNLSASLLFVLPCFGQTVDGVLQEVSLPKLTAVAPYMRYLYWDVVCSIVLTGALLLCLSRCHRPFWLSCKYPLATALNAIGVVLFILGSQPYAAALLFVFLIIQVLLLFRVR